MAGRQRGAARRHPAGARSALIGHETGSLAAGKKADLMILNMTTAAFTPLNDIRNHLVYCENGSSIEKVIVEGAVVVDHGRLTKVDEIALLAELRALMPEFLSYHTGVEQQNALLTPYFNIIHRRCNEIDIGVQRLATDDVERAWPVNR